MDFTRRLARFDSECENFPIFKKGSSPATKFFTIGKQSATLTTTEEKAEGDVMWCTYSYYIKAGGIGNFFAVILSICLFQALTVVASYWLAFWGTQEIKNSRRGSPLSTEANMYYLNYYALYTMMGVVALTVRAITLAHHRIGTSVRMHEDLVSRTFGATVAFFDVTPQGRLLNRFSSDMAIIDEELSQSISLLTNALFSVFGSIAAIAVATQGYFLILILPLIVIYERIQRYFKKSNTAIARLQSVSLSPIYTDVAQALAGLSTIRAYNGSQRFCDRLQRSVDYNTVPLVMSQLAIQWLTIRLHLIGSLVSFFIAVLAIASDGLIPASFLALGLTYSFQMSNYLKFAVRMMATAEGQMNSVERVKYYIDNIEQEDVRVMRGRDGKIVTVPDEWPDQGAVTGKGLQMRYRDGPLVLKGVDFHIEGGEKIGIAGRTGSGKSSLMISIFRIQDLSMGCIIIDGIDTRTIPRSTLRSRIGIIPQDPVIFSASVRFNLDPFNKHTDAQIWSVLESVEMKDYVATLPDKLDEEVAESGDNFSAGQRQLLCIARALLRKPKILFLDEATASIDMETDEMIQKMVRVNFQECTVLTIAHRLNTIIDSDRVIVMDSGVMAECGPPDMLLSNQDGIFKSLWDKHQKNHMAAQVTEEEEKEEDENENENENENEKEETYYALL
jgi:ATP-binding cassette, subfamily C (CFTR/MRP), member 1